TTDLHDPLHSFPTRRSSDLIHTKIFQHRIEQLFDIRQQPMYLVHKEDLTSFDIRDDAGQIQLLLQYRPRRLIERHREFLRNDSRSEEHTSELQSPYDLVCRL